MLDKITGRALVNFALVLMVSLSIVLYISFSDVQKTYKDSSDRISEQLEKKHQLSIMYSAARERSLILLQMYREKDPFELDDLNQSLGEQARNFIRAREKLFSLQLSNIEKEILLKQNQATLKNAPLQDMVSELFRTERYQEAESLLFNRALPGQNIVLKKIDEIIQQYKADTLISLDEIEHKKESANNRFKLFAFLLVLGGASFIGFLISYISKKEQKHFDTQISQQKIAAERLSYQASHDPLTSLINRREFEHRLQQLLEQSTGHDNHAVIYLDLDQFKIVNDTCGHHAGDGLLKQIQSILEPHLRNSDLLARLGGDEFAIILFACELEMVKRICQKIIESFSKYRYSWEEKVFKIGVSIGIVEITDKTDNLHDVLKFADSACYAAKEAGRNQFVVYQHKDSSFTSRSEELNWLSKVNDALEQDNFILFAQIIVPTDSDLGLKPSYEILVRMSDNGKIVPPGCFLPAAERYDQMLNIDKWVVSNTISMMADNEDFIGQIDHIAMNLSGQSIANQDFVDFVVDAVKGNRLAKKICFEITETAAVNNLAYAKKAMAILHGMGVSFSLDDFGSGLSSYAYLRTFDVDYLKIDGLFVKNILDDPIDYAMVRSINEIGKLMGKKTIAEFVESGDILVTLKDIGVDYAQGYGVGKPMPFIDVIESYQTKRMEAV